MVDASEFVDGASLDVRLLAGTAVGSIMVTYWALAVRLYEAAASTFQSLLLSPIDAGSDLLEQLLMIPGNSLHAANAAAEEFVIMLEPIGPFVWPVAMLITVVTMWTLQWLNDEFGVI